ncbi:MAG: PAS domain S-box protein [Desulfobacterales bacterium]|nr:PAS domain S-box protein [Desulfobacterales bacterium]
MKLKTRLLIVILLALIPTILLIVFNTIEDHKRLTSEAKEEAHRLTRLIADNLNNIVDSTQHLLIALSKIEEVKQIDTEGCNKLFSELIKEYPLYANLLGFTPDGSLFCSAFPVNKPVNVINKNWFKSVLKNRKFVVSDYQFGSSCSKDVITMLYPVSSYDGEIDLILAANLDLKWLNKDISQAKLPEGTTIRIIDRNGTVLSRRPDPDKWVGKSFADSPVIKIVLKEKEGTIEAIEGIDNVKRLYAFTSLKNNIEIYVSVGIPQKLVYEKINTYLKYSLLIIFLIASIAIFGAMLVSHFSIVVPIKKLIKAAKDLGNGDLKTRANLANQGEFSELANAFDSMCESLEKKEDERSQIEQMLEKTFASLDEVILITEPITRMIIDCNEAIDRIFGYTKQEVIGKNTSFLHVDQNHYEEFGKELFSSLDKKGIFYFNFEMKRKNGTIFPSEHVVTEIIDESKNRKWIVSVVRDISSRKESEQKIIESEKRLNRILENLPAGVIYIEGDNISMNKTAETLTGYSRFELKTLDDLFKSLYPRREHEVRRIYEADKVIGFREKRDILITCKNGQLRHIEFSRITLEEEEIWVFNDINKRKKMEEAITESEERYRSLIEASPNAIVLIDLDGNFIAANYQCALLYGYNNLGEMFQNRLNFFDLILSTDRKMAKENINSILEKGVLKNIEYNMIKKDLTHFPSEVSMSIVKSTNGIPETITGIIRDITDKRKAEEERLKLEAQFRHVQKMEAIGTLAGGIAHDFNNILSIITGYTELSIEHLAKGNAIKDHLMQINKATQRAKELINQILTFSRKTEKERQEIRVSLIVKETLKLLRASLPSTIKIRQDIQANFSLVLAETTQLHQVIMNLCTNASHAMREDGGTLTVSLIDLDIKDSDINSGTRDLSPGPYIRLTVSDTGHGMDKATMERIFDPFFTTKKQGEGTGMGLSVVHGIVKSCEGMVIVQSEPKKGSTFHVYLPKVEGKVKLTSAPKQPLPQGTERLLFVDDEAPMVDLWKDILQHLGYKVITETSSVKALETFRNAQNSEEKFDILITDQTMPNMTGLKLSQEIKNMDPNIPIIICTGYSESVTSETIKNLGIEGFLTKPLSMREVAKMIRELLDKKI